jgi:hypothetical protein
MVYRPAVNQKLCFVLMPFGQPFDGYYEFVIKPAVERAGLEALRADEIYGTNAIIQDIWESICVIRRSRCPRRSHDNLRLVSRIPGGMAR